MSWILEREREREKDEKVGVRWFVTLYAKMVAVTARVVIIAEYC
jgi:hypothetical protein